MSAASRSTALVVATECPTCGAPLDFEQGTNAITCRHCGSKLLVTGRHQVLSYAIPPRIDAARALAAARGAPRAADATPSFETPRLHLVPYYRLTGVELAWERAAPKRAEQPDLRALLDACGADVMQVATVLAGTREPREETTLATRHVERNFLACDTQGLVPYSLGIRPSVLRLRLFRPDLAPAGTRILAPTLSDERARVHGLLRPGTDLVLHREALGCELSIIYFPFWSVTTRGATDRPLMVDGTSGEVVEDVGGRTPDVAADPPAEAPPHTLGFRALACPNCGWELDADPLDVIFPCGSCRKAWRIVGDDLEATPHAVAAGGGDGAAVEHLPVWMIAAEVTDAEGGRAARRFLVPAFRCRTPKLLADLAARLSAEDGTLATRDDEVPLRRGCHLDRDDAIALARFLSAAPTRAATRAQPGRTSARLTQARAELYWLPFTVGPHALREPFTGAALPPGILAEHRPLGRREHLH